jgi:hypothetical protein
MEPTVYQAPILHKRQYRVTSREIQGTFSVLTDASAPPAADQVCICFSHLVARLLELLTVYVERLSFASPVCGVCLVLGEYAG